MPPPPYTAGARPIINPSKKEHSFAGRSAAVWKLLFLKQAFLLQNPSRWRAAPPCRLPSSFLPFLCDRNSLVSFHLCETRFPRKDQEEEKTQNGRGKTDRIAWKKNTHLSKNIAWFFFSPAFPSHVPFAIITLALKRGWGGQLLLFPPSKQKKNALISALFPSIQVYYCGLASETQPAPKERKRFFCVPCIICASTPTLLPRKYSLAGSGRDRDLAPNMMVCSFFPENESSELK